MPAIEASTRAQRDAALHGARAAYLMSQDPTVYGGHNYQSRVFERDRPLNSRLGGGTAVLSKGRQRLSRYRSRVHGSPGPWVCCIGGSEASG